MHVRLHTSTGFLHACPSLCKASTRLCIRPQGSCKPARRSARLLTSLQACTPICKPAQTSCTHACDFARAHVTLQACTRYVQAGRTACSLASHVCIDTRRTFSVKGTPTPPHSVVPLLFFFLIDKLFLLELF